MAERCAKVAQLDAFLAQLEAELGPIVDDDAREAAAWASRLAASRQAASRV